MCDFIKNKFKAMILNGAIGDQYGAPIEMMPRETILNKYSQDDLESYLITFRNQEPGKQYTFTDDTQMTIAVIDAIIETSGNITAELLLEKYLFFFQPFRGYCIKIYNLFEELYNNNKKMSDNLVISLQDNGGIMRVSPLSIVCYDKSYQSIINLVEMVHYPTHQNKTANQVSCLFVKCLISFSKIKSPTYELIIETYKELLLLSTEKEITDKLLTIINHHNDDEFIILDDLIGLDAVECHESFACALWCILKNMSDVSHVKNIVKKAITYGGDTDTIAGLVGQLSGALYGFDAVKENWLMNLEARSYIESQCDKILNIYF